MTFGHKDSFAIEIGESIAGSQGLFALNIWLLGHHVTRVDNVAYLETVLAQAQKDLVENRNLERFSRYFTGRSVVEAHLFIQSTRDEESCHFDIEDDIYAQQQILNWGPNTDNVACFLIPIAGTLYATVQFYDSEGEEGIFYGKMDAAYFHSVVQGFIDGGKKRLPITGMS